MEKIYEAADLYADELIESVEFKRLIELKDLIKNNLSGKIMAFKTAEAKYLEAKSYGKYHPNLEEYKNLFIKTKTSLYTHPYVKEYKELEGKIQDSINKDINEIKSSISKTFKLNF